MSGFHFSAPLGRLVIVALLASIVGTGCSQKKKTTTVSGTVTYQGVPVSVGAIYFHGSGDQVGMGTIAKDGSFTATDVPLGDERVSLQVRDPGVYAQQLKQNGNGLDPNEPAPGQSAGVRTIPPKYADPQTSELVYKIESKPSPIHVKLD